MLIEALSAEHIREGFTCGKPQLDHYITQMAGQDAKRDQASVFVLLDEGSPEIIGYYSLSAYGVLLSDLPEEFQKKLGRYPSVPATLLGRLAVNSGRKGQRLGEYLLMDALRRAEATTRDVASAVVVVDAIDDEAKTFYEKYDFRPFTDHPMKLYLPMGTIRALPF